MSSFGFQSKIAILIFAAISECSIYAEAKYCAFEIHGEPKYYVCPRTEYCCNFGCCVSPGFQIYHLWYYWLLVIIMFLVCSGGGWWYRYWLQGRYRPSTSTIPPRSSNSRAQLALRGPTCRAQQARVTYNPARNTVLLHRMWKGPQRNTTPPAYNGAVAAASSAQFQNTNVVLNDNNCPYYELYGPPPSYETVIAQTRGKLMSHTPATLDDSAARTNPQTSPIVQQNQNIAHCFSHNSYGSSPTRINVDNDAGDRPDSCGSNFEESGDNYQSFGYKNIGQKSETQQVLRLGGNNLASDNIYQENTASGTRTNVPQNILKILPFCVPESRTEQRAESLGDTDNSSGNLAIIEDSGYDRSAACASSQFNKRIDDVRSFGELGEEKFDDLEIEIMETEKPNDENHIRLDNSNKVSRIPKMFVYSKGESSEDDSLGAKYERAQSNSLKERSSGVLNRGEYRNKYFDVHRNKESNNKKIKNKRTTTTTTEEEEEEEASCCSPSSSSCSSLSILKKNGISGLSKSTKKNYHSECEECIESQNISHNFNNYYSQLNPSNNVILSSPTTTNNPINVQIIDNSSLPPINIIENYQHYPPTTTTRTSPTQQRSLPSTSTNFESENKLGRSKSLD